MASRVLAVLGVVSLFAVACGAGEEVLQATPPPSPAVARPSPTPWPTPTRIATPAPTPPQTYPARPLDNGTLFGDFSIALSQVKRVPRDDTYDTVQLSFAIRRVNRTTDENAWLLAAAPSRVQIIDDHGNTYEGEEWRDVVSSFGAGWDIEYAYVPVGFTWVETYRIPMPRPAPIKKIEIMDRQSKVMWEIDYTTYEPACPNLGAELKEGLISPGETFVYDEFLQWSVGEPKLIDTSYTYFEVGAKYKEVSGKDVLEWLIPFEVENRDYNAREIELRIKVQERDGELRGDVFDYTFYGGYFFDNSEDDPRERPESYAVVPQQIAVQIPALTKVSLRYYRIPSLSERPEDMPIKLLILTAKESGFKELYILKLSEDVAVC